MASVFDYCCLKIDGISYPLPTEVPHLLKEGDILVDIRSELETEIRAIGIEQIIYLSHYEFEEKWKSHPLDKPLILTDAVGLWSKHYAHFLHGKGYTEVVSLAGGIADWEKDALPMRAGKYMPLNGPCPCMIVPTEPE